MRDKKKKESRKGRGDRGEPLTLSDIPRVTKKSMRGIMKDLVGTHSTEIAMRIREGTLSENLRLALKYITLVSAYESGKPVETHRMVGLNEGPSGSYDLSKLDTKEQKQLLTMLRKAKDATEPSGDA